MLLVAPVGVARRAVVPIGAPWRERWTVWAVAACAVSAVLGAASHLLWDTFTHSDGWGPHHIHALGAPLHLPVVGTVIVHQLLQYGSTAVGLIVLTIVIVRALARQPLIELPELPRAAPRALAAACIACAIALVIARQVGRHTAGTGYLIASIIAGALAGTLIASALLWSRGRRLVAAVAAQGVIVSANV
jgi:hypothetical protein